MSTTDSPLEREEIRELLADNVQALHERIQRSRAEGLSEETEQLQLRRLRTMAQLARQYRLLAQDADIDEMEADVALLKEAIDGEKR